MNTRLKQFLAAENITQAQFADTINVVRASVSHILSGRNNPSYDFIKAMMASYPNLNMEWLMFGKGKMYKDAQNSDFDLFPHEEDLAALPATPQESDIIDHETDLIEPTLPSTDINTLNNTPKPSVKQRKVSKIIILFDDGTYQEL